MNYSAMSEEKHKQCSKILSNARSKPPSTVSSFYPEPVAQPDIMAQPEIMAEPEPLTTSTADNSCPNSCSSSTHVEPRTLISEFNINSGQMCTPQPKHPHNIKELSNLPVPHPSSQMQAPSISSNSIAFVNDTVTMNTQMNSLFPGAVLNIQNFNFHMK